MGAPAAYAASEAAIAMMRMKYFVTVSRSGMSQSLVDWLERFKGQIGLEMARSRESV